MNLINWILKSKKNKGIKFSYYKTDWNLIVLEFSGKCLPASRGNEQGEFIYCCLDKYFKKLNIENSNGIIIDFSNLEYNFGNYIFNAISIINRLDLPRAIVYSDKSINLKNNLPNLFFDRFETAKEYLRSEK